MSNDKHLKCKMQPRNKDGFLEHITTTEVLIEMKCNFKIIFYNVHIKMNVFIKPNFLANQILYFAIKYTQ